ncbi:MAG: T9SS type A sorting domain-containing protein [Bacteroidota bacterium]
MIRLIAMIVIVMCLTSATTFDPTPTDIRLRLTPNLYEASTNTIYVDVEMRYEGTKTFTLADQNYRLYYDTKSLSLDPSQCHSDLPYDLYSQMQFHEEIKHASADHINQLSFDDDLGFVNFSIDLINENNGGLSLSSDAGWARVAILKFDLLAEHPASIVWGRDKATDEYATAFVEIMEWKGPNQIVPARVQEYHDAQINPPVKEDDESYLSLDASPNPAKEFVKLDLGNPLAGTKISISDASGTIVQQTRSLPHISQMSIDLSPLNAGTYTIEVQDESTGERKQVTIVKVK